MDDSDRGDSGTGRGIRIFKGRSGRLSTYSVKRLRRRMRDVYNKFWWEDEKFNTARNQGHQLGFKVEPKAEKEIVVFVQYSYMFCQIRKRLEVSEAQHIDLFKEILQNFAGTIMQEVRAISPRKAENLEALWSYKVEEKRQKFRDFIKSVIV